VREESASFVAAVLALMSPESDSPSVVCELVVKLLTNTADAVRDLEFYMRNTFVAAGVIRAPSDPKHLERVTRAVRQASRILLNSADEHGAEHDVQTSTTSTTKTECIIF
jgi:hypothetical protein